MLRRRSPQGATLAPDGSARPDCTGCCVRRGGNYRTLHTEKSTQRGDGALPMPQGRGLRADREGQEMTSMDQMDQHAYQAQRSLPTTSRRSVLRAGLAAGAATIISAGLWANATPADAAAARQGLTPGDAA